MRRILTLATVLLLSFVSSACFGTATRDETGSITSSGDLDVFSLADGDCFKEEDVLNKEVTKLEALPCDQPHDAQVFANFSLPDTKEFPGESKLEAEAESGCTSRHETALGITFENSKYTFGYLQPTKESWALKDRQITCYIATTPDQVTVDFTSNPQLLTREDTPLTPEEEASSGEEVNIFSLTEGDCFIEEDVLNKEVTEVKSIPCDQPHDAQVYIEFTVPDSETYPGEEKIDVGAGEGCKSRYKEKIGIDFEQSVHTIGYIRPTSRSWLFRKDRTITCYVSTAPEKVAIDLIGSGT